LITYFIEEELMTSRRIARFSIAVLLGASAMLCMAQPTGSTPSATTSIVITPEEVVQFMNDFELLGEKKNFDLWTSMIHEKASYRLNDGDFFGLPEIRKIVEQTWVTYRTAENARFYLSDMRVIHVDRSSASVTFTYNWEWIKDGRPNRAQGRGTRVVVRDQGRLKIIHMHLSPFPSVLLQRATGTPAPAVMQ